MCDFSKRELLETMRMDIDFYILLLQLSDQDIFICYSANHCRKLVLVLGIRDVHSDLPAINNKHL